MYYFVLFGDVSPKTAVAKENHGRSRRRVRRCKKNVFNLGGKLKAGEM